MHAVQGAEERGFAAAAGADNCGHGSGGNLQAQVLDCLMLPEPATEAVHLEGHLGHRGAARSCLSATGGCQAIQWEALIVFGLQGGAFSFGLCHGHARVHRVAPENLPRVSARTPMLMRKIIRINTRAPAQAWRCQSS